jgi:nucleoside 2-deoxyribosyltransferase
MTRPLDVVGGLYIERCVQPLWDSVFGSGGRAAAAASGLVEEVVLHTYVAEGLRRDAEGLAARFGFSLDAHPTSDSVKFDYFHPLSTPNIWPAPVAIAQNAAIKISGDVVLRFGMLEGDAVVDADWAIYDPQSAFGAVPFTKNGSKARHLALVLNRTEARALSGESDPASAIDRLLQAAGAECVVLKRGSQGALVATPTDRHVISTYVTNHVFKIGSGDVFSAAFGVFWGHARLDPFTAADLASRAAAQYVDTRQLPSSKRLHLAQLPYRPTVPGSGMIYIAAPFFDIGQRWLVDELRGQILAAGAQVFSPVHDVGRGPAESIAPADLLGLEQSDVVLAVINGHDPGTLVEVGYAIKAKKPVIALAQEMRPEDLKMLVGTQCDVVDDFATAVFRAIWQLPS